MTEPATHFRDTVRAFFERTGTSPVRLGADVPGDPSFVYRLMQGRNPRLDTADRVLAFMGAAPIRRHAFEETDRPVRMAQQQSARIRANRPAIIKGRHDATRIVGFKFVLSRDTFCRHRSSLWNLLSLCCEKLYRTLEADAPLCVRYPGYVGHCFRNDTARLEKLFKLYIKMITKKGRHDERYRFLVG